MQLKHPCTSVYIGFHGALSRYFLSYNSILVLVADTLFLAFSLTGRPTLRELLKFTRADKRKINIAEEIADEYKMFGTFLLEDDTGQKVRSMEIKHHFDPSKINTQILEEWIKGKGKQPLTWGTLIEVLREIELTTLANDISTIKCDMKSIL